MTVSAPSTVSSIPDVERIARFRDRPAVWLSYGGAAVLGAYRERLEPLGLRPSWVTALAIVEEKEGITQSGLARELRINRASAMAISQRMDEEGLVLREALPGRNRTGLTLTAKGEERLAQACAIERCMVEEWMGDIGEEDFEAFLRVLKTMVARAACSQPRD
ncbi:MarR family winged helix-turn-helix transcriptional regulator [Novosphingobium profundi]|uniref:MarR family winged helix-turn-helix transcriptional regulator n=1 Tax=Novosphingobium profundi TaxID=1774954 RepID=UPI001CFE44E8|nr:MarR family winged helix-turn-helix transcriptional regulator [Novosphingobium profundi]